MITYIKDKNNTPLRVGCVVKDMYDRYWHIESFEKDSHDNDTCKCANGGTFCYSPPHRLEWV